MKYLAYYLKRSHLNWTETMCGWRPSARFIDCRSRFKNSWKNPGNNFQEHRADTGACPELRRARGDCGRIAGDRRKGAVRRSVPEEVTETLFGMHLYTSQIPIRIFWFEPAVKCD